MKSLDEHEVKIIRELIRNPRISDNQLSRKSGVPVMTVNRKRKNLEQSGMISYFTDIKHGDGGTEDFHVKQLYIIKFKLGITRTEYLEKTKHDKKLKKFNAEHIVSSYIAERDGHLALIIIVNAHTSQDLNESFNAHIVPKLKKNYGDDCIQNIETIRILEPLREHHNYIHGINMDKGKIREDWPDDYIFVDIKSFHKHSDQSKLDHHL